MSEQLPDGGHPLSQKDIDALDARWANAWTPAEVAARLDGVTTPWYVAAGWALDLFRGGKTREHEDLEIAVPAGRFAEVRDRFPGHLWDAVGYRRVWTSPGPEALAAVHQTWLRDPVTDEYRLDVFREPHDGDTWICRRDETLRLPYADIIRRTPDGIPYLAPELVLLFKARNVRPKDQVDFDGVVPLLSDSQRAELRALLTRVHPGHEWLAGL
ncbi:nucleotidyltransferase domain-containing protein [Phytomonospora endophytica]|uniref:Amino acid transporter n=1 Tax=Phytomonospora endophytica TaxID=714109 RepID=A0A841FBZ3_9ACTN|nr:hypothetical protein [Phytomonospora endophytica]MBB6032513.1 hypothetical protein [Phytomonospora endophytica]GIG66338.1 hypothetical protein Pen01_26330 [Phytomonospora endophytica]